MKVLLSLLYLSASVITAKSQNLVPNPTFVLYDTCPVGSNGYGQLDKCTSWYTPTSLSTDFYHICWAGWAGSLPHSSTSNSYIGFHAYNQFVPNYREYAGTDIPALIIGAKYRVLITVSLDVNSYTATTAPAVFFYKDISLINHAMVNNLPFTPQVDFSTAGYITEKINWVTVIDTFIADSTYTHLIIGNFKDDTTTNKTTLTPPGNGAYYLIDSISVEKIGTAPSSVIDVDNKQEIKATLYPNPFAGNAVLHIENLIGNNNTLSISNARGALVRKIENISAGQTTISSEGLAPGFYYYQLRSQYGGTVNGKMIIR